MAAILIENGGSDFPRVDPYTHVVGIENVVRSAISKVWQCRLSPQLGRTTFCDSSASSISLSVQARDQIS